MNLKLDYQIKRIIKNNLIYLVTLAILVICYLLSIYFFTRQYKTGIDNIESLNRDLSDLESKKSLIEYKDQVLKNEIDLDQANAILAQLVPNEEDFFSIIVALEKLSEQTNFIITSYTISIANSNPGKLSISISGQGDINSFVTFLENYNFGGGRLITIDNIDYQQGSFSGTTLALNFYSGKGPSDQALKPFSNADKKLIEKIMQKVKLEVKSNESEIMNYPVKSNPF
ncbi:MAG: hypothetical protein M1409_09805 [Actinobacteria bacterium]|nr:hypothetical protein [Actinomycetota bacterium]